MSTPFTKTVEKASSSLMRRTLRHLSTLLVITAIAVGTTACDQFDLDEPQPTTSVSLDQAVNTTSGFNSLLNSGYDRLQGVAFYGQQWILYPEALADNAQFQKGKTHLARRDTAAALTAFRAVPERHPRSPYADRSLFRAGKLLESSGQPAEAMSAYNRLLSEYPKSLLAGEVRGRLRLLQQTQG